jgi:hypothetical protein
MILNPTANNALFTPKEVIEDSSLRYIDAERTKDIQKIKAILPDVPNAIDPKPRRIAVFDSNGDKIFVGLKDDISNIFSESIFLALADGLLSNYFLGLAKNRGYLTNIRDFIIWLNTYKIDSVSRYIVLNKYESYRVNDLGVKTQSSGLEKLIPLIRNGLGSLYITDEQYQYLLLLLDSTSISSAEDRVQISLSSWFAKPWLRPIMGERSYLKLESSRLLMESFKITIGVVLDLLLDTKAEINNILHSQKISPLSLMRSILSSDNQKDIQPPYNTDYDIYNKSSTQKRRAFSLELFWKIHLDLESNNSENQTRSATYEITKYDLLNKEMYTTVCNELEKCALVKPPQQYSENNKQKKNNFNCSLLFSPEQLSSSNQLEELLVAWIVATLCLQPTAIEKIKISNFTREYNSNNKLIAIFSHYFKPRSARSPDVPVLDGQLIESKAFDKYLKQVEKTRENLFSNNKTPTIRYITREHEGNAQPSNCALLTKIIDNQLVKQKIISEHKKRKVDPIFLSAFIALDASKAEPWEQFYKKHRNEVELPRELYCETFHDAVPVALFKLSHIKNSAVHSRYDEYRDGDLINQNSHSSQTEKVSYINDSNKDAVNHQGRVSRQVMLDISDNLYRPSLIKALKKTRDIQLQTSIRQVSNEEQYKINSFGIAIDAEVEAEHFDDQVVIECEETMLYMIHYLSQVETYGVLLAKNNLPFFESEVLPKTIWMEDVLSQFNNKALLSQTYEKHKKIAKNLPLLFENEMKGGIA